MRHPFRSQGKLSVVPVRVGIPLLVCLCILLAGPMAKEITVENEHSDLSDARTIKTYYEVIPGTSFQQVVALAIMDAPVESVWQTIIDYQGLGKGSAIIKVRDVREMEDGRTQIDLVLDLPWPMDDMDCLLLFTEDDEVHEIKWHNIGGCVKNNSGRIRLEKVNGKTLMKFSVAIELGKKYLPQWLVNWVIRYKLPDEINLIRKSVKEGMK